MAGEQLPGLLDNLWLMCPMGGCTQGLASGPCGIGGSSKIYKEGCVGGSVG